MTYLLPQRSEPLLLSVSVDVSANAKGDNIEEGYPCLLWQELLSEGQSNGRGDPGNLHDRHEAGTHRGADLMPGTSTSDDCHGGEVHSVLDGRNLVDVSALTIIMWRCPTIRLDTMI